VIHLNFDSYNEIVEDTKKISSALKKLSKESKLMVFCYISALNDKEVAEKERQLQKIG